MTATLIIREYTLAALQESPQSYGTAVRPCILHQGKRNLPPVAHLYRNPRPQCSLSKLSAHEALGATVHLMIRGRRFTEGKNPTRFDGRFRDLSGASFPLLRGVSSSFKQGRGIRAGVDIGPADHDSSSFKAAEGHYKVGDRFWSMMTNTNKKLQDYMNTITGSTTEEKEEEEPENVETDWEKWQKVFVEVEKQEKLASMLVIQLEAAVEKEHFQKAAMLKEAIAEISANDGVSEAMKELKSALVEERYDDAANLRDKAGAGLLGWWVGLPESENESYGHIVHISAAQGRFIAKSYNASQLTAGKGPGAPMFEVFVSKIGKNNYNMQAVYLRQCHVIEENMSSDTDTTDLIVDAPEGFQQNTPDIWLKPAETDHDHDHDHVGSRTGMDEDRIYETSHAPVVDDSNNMMEKQESEGSSVKLLITDLMQNSLDDKLDVVAPVRIPAQLERKTKDSFVFHFEEVYQLGSWRSTIAQSEAICGRAELNVEEGSMADKLSSVTVISKVATEMEKVARLAVTQVRRSQRLAEVTSFRRIDTLETGSDPLSGLYVGNFGFYTSRLEVVQLRRKFGNWGVDKDKLEFFEYVEAVKLTGALDFPAGEVVFRAKISQGSRLPSRGMYPEEFGVTGSYKGQVRLVEPGSQIQHIQWTNGELVLLDRKRGSRRKGSELGFVYSTRERRFLVLFNRLKLQN